MKFDSKTTLLIVSVIVLMIGFLALVPDLHYYIESWWFAAIEILIGLFGLFVFYKEKA
jgi:hypothetical protein